jgi:hypothetical protein
MAWFVLVFILANNPLTSSISALAGIATASMVDLLYRAMNQREKGAIRLVHCDCGGTYLAIPVWVVGLMMFAAFGQWLFLKR